MPSVACARCGQTVDTSHLKPLSTTRCTGCEAPMRVPGRIGQFLLTRMLGRGAMGAVFEGVDEELGRRVAIKVLTPRKGQDAALVLHDLLSEARALARINHPNVVQIHSVGQHRDQPYIVMELVGGGPRLEDFAAGRARLGEHQSLELLISVAQGLAVAARAHLVHGDIKPQNILVNAAGEAKVVDFGLTQKARQSAGSTVWGTPYYIAPERARGGTCDTRSDIFSLGATVWHLLAGRPPYEGKTVRDVVAARLHGPPPDVRKARPDVHAPTTSLLQRMMATRPGDRPTTFDRVAEEARAAMHQVLNDASDALAALAAKSAAIDRHASTTRDSRTSPARPFVRRILGRPLWWMAAGAGVLALAAVALLIAFAARTPEPPAAPEQSVQAADDTFDGRTLAPGWTAANAALNGKGQLLLSAYPTGAQPSATRMLGQGDFSGTLELSSMDWSSNLTQSIAVTINDAAAELRIIIRKAKADYPIATVVSHTGAAEQTLYSQPLPFDPESIELWLGWAESDQQWIVGLGIDGARPRRIATANWPAGSSPQRRLRVAGAAEGASGNFSAALDRWRVEPGVPTRLPR